jgi:arginine metabolism regulation protein II
LVWNDTDSKHPDKNNCHLMTEHEVMQTITKIDRSATRPAPTTLGPFSVFSLQTSSPSDSPTSDTQGEIVDQPANPPNQAMHHNGNKSGSQHQVNGLDYRLWNDSLMTDNAFECLDSLGTSMGVLSDEADSFTHQTDEHPNYSEGDLMRSPIQALSPESSDEIPLCSQSGAGNAIEPLDLVSSRSLDMAMTPERDDTTAQSSDMPNSTSHWQNRRLSDTESLIRTSALMRCDWGLPMSIVGNNTTSDMLIHHYAKHMVHLMQPVSHQANPFRTIYLPLAIEGSPNMEIVRPSDRIYSASVTVFHSLLAMAAIHLQSLQSREESLRRLACHHKQRALVALRSALATRSSNYKDLMTAILSLVSADVSVPSSSSQIVLRFRSSMVAPMTIGYI